VKSGRSQRSQDEGKEDLRRTVPQAKMVLRKGMFCQLKVPAQCVNCSCSNCCYMELTETTTKVDKLALLLLFLSSWEEKTLEFSIRRAWKGIDFGILDRLQENGYISQSRTAKSLCLTEEGEKEANKLLKLLEHIK
jgi:hypothetical protein